jgi:hypothetical protein
VRVASIDHLVAMKEFDGQGQGPIHGNGVPHPLRRAARAEGVSTGPSTQASRRPAGSSRRP